MLGTSDIKELTAKFSDSKSMQAYLMGQLNKSQEEIANRKEINASNQERSQLLFEEAVEDQSKIDAYTALISSTDANRKDEIARADKEIEQAEESKQQKFRIGKFVDESGMCGMGMGMGNTYSDKCAIELTAEELVAIGEVYACFDEVDSASAAGEDVDNFQEVADHLNEKLGDKGTKVTTGCEDGTKFIEITRSDGSTVKIYDANGNGALDNKDYEFCKYMDEAIQIVNEANDKIKAAEEAKVIANNLADKIISDANANISDLTVKKQDDTQNALRYQNEAKTGKQLVEGMIDEHNAKSEQLQLTETTMAQQAASIGAYAAPQGKDSDEENPFEVGKIDTSMTFQSQNYRKLVA